MNQPYVLRSPLLPEPPSHLPPPSYCILNKYYRAGHGVFIKGTNKVPCKYLEVAESSSWDEEGLQGHLKLAPHPRSRSRVKDLRAQGASLVA